MITIFQCIKGSSTEECLVHDKELVKLNCSKMLKTFLTVMTVTEPLKQIAKRALEFPQLGVFKKQTSVRNDLGIVDVALEGTGSSTVLFFLIFCNLNWRKKNWFF